MIYFLGILAWLVPGAGHWYVGQRQRGTVIFIAVIGAYVLGVLLGGIEMIDPRNATAWFCAQVLCGLPNIICAVLQDPNVPMGVGRGVDLGQVYTGVAGLLNLLAVLDALTRCQASNSPSTPGDARA
jgi:hypothetical protein